MEGSGEYERMRHSTGDSGTAAADFRQGLPSGARILVTGGSGFIGTNLVEAYRRAEVPVVNVDLRPPRNPAHRDFWWQVDLTRPDDVGSALDRFAPTHVVHLGARTDLDGRSLADYEANIGGVESLIRAIRELPRPLDRLLVASSRMVCRIGYQPSSDEDYCPPNAYGASKVETERLVRGVVDVPWVLGRPTSIWGPWFDVPYRDFFLNVARRRYVHPSGRRIDKHFGFVGNTVWQLHRLLVAPASQVLGRTFYLADDPPIEVFDLATRIGRELGKGPPRSVPAPVLAAMAKAGDAIERTGRRAPLTRFRLDNLLTTMLHDLGPVNEVAGPSPVPLQPAVRGTVQWMRDQGLVDAQRPSVDRPRRTASS